ncbi:hypothetical protein NXV65_12260 [Bacteroides fragilis]|nr:hypothetical protein [Bacteroides fragilis]MCS2884376.1 hypothetical protein [Bacteroides fragilis]
MEKEKAGEGKGHIIILYKGKFIGEREKGICRERGKEKCLREEIEEKIGNLTGSKQKIRWDCDKD